MSQTNGTGNGDRLRRGGQGAGNQVTGATIGALAVSVGAPYLKAQYGIDPGTATMAAATGAAVAGGVLGAVAGTLGATAREQIQARPPKTFAARFVLRLLAGLG